MKIFILGKRGSVVHWAEDAMVAFQAAGHTVRFGITRDPRLTRTIERVLVAGWAGAPRAAWQMRAIRRFTPDLILAVGPYSMPEPILAPIAALTGRPPLLGWVGDTFSADAAPQAALLDAVAYTDSGLLAAHHALGWATPAVYLPHAASPRLDGVVADPAARHDQMVFVANPTPHRRDVVRAISRPLRLFGIGWTALPPASHAIQPRHIGIDELAAIYRTGLAALNIRNENNVLAGLNQRHFDPYLAATPVVSDDQADLARCFEPGTEALVYRDAAALNEIYARLQREPALAVRIGAAGRRRVLAEHMYEHRLAALLRLV
jgi:spore maturation protein CgeB